MFKILILLSVGVFTTANFCSKFSCINCILHPNCEWILREDFETECQMETQLANVEIIIDDITWCETESISTTLFPFIHSTTTATPKPKAKTTKLTTLLPVFLPTTTASPKTTVKTIKLTTLRPVKPSTAITTPKSTPRTTKLITVRPFIPSSTPRIIKRTVRTTKWTTFRPVTRSSIRTTSKMTTKKPKSRSSRPITTRKTTSAPRRTPPTPKMSSPLPLTTRKSTVAPKPSHKTTEISSTLPTTTLKITTEVMMDPEIAEIIPKPTEIHLTSTEKPPIIANNDSTMLGNVLIILCMIVFSFGIVLGLEIYCQYKIRQIAPVEEIEMRDLH